MTTVAEASKRYVSLCRASKMGCAISTQILEEVNSLSTIQERMVYLAEIRLNVELFIRDLDGYRGAVRHE